MRYLFVIGILLALCAAGSAQNNKKKLVWQPGKVVITQYEAGINTVTVKEGDVNSNAADYEKDKTREIATRDDYETIRVQTSDGIYFAGRSNYFFWQNRLKVTNGEAVQLAVRDDFIYVKTSKGRKAKYHLIGIEPNPNGINGK